MKLKLFALIICLVMKISSENTGSYSINNHGSLGLINTPSARLFSAPYGSFSIYRGYPDRKMTLSLYPYEWLEASIFYSSISNKPYGSGFSQDYKDKGFNLKALVKEQGYFPAIAVGAYDIGGTGYYSSEYIVSSYNIKNFDINFGLGWGQLNNHNHFSNPLSILSDNFKTRSSTIGEGGNFSLDNYFSGKSVSLFGGLGIAISNKQYFKIEYDPLYTEGPIEYRQRKSDLSIGYEYKFNDITFGLNYERGSNISVNLSFKDDFFIQEHRYQSIKSKTKNNYHNLVKTLRRNNIGVSKIQKKEDVTFVTVTQYAHFYNELKDIVNQSLADSGYVEKVITSYKVAGLEVINNDEIEDSSLLYQNDFSGWNHKFSLNIRPFLAGREDFIKASLLIEHDAEFVFNENLFFSTNIKLSVLDNLDDLIYPPVNTYPAQTRSDIKKYLNNLGERPSIGRAQLEYFKTIKNNNHILLSAGIYEDMFSGYGFEYLNYNPNSKFNWGFEAHEAYKRGYKYDFELLGYKNLTYHFNLFYKNRDLIPFDLKTSFGEYLAGDTGITIELSRTYKGGIEIGTFATFTNVSKKDFGEGSFDKGIFFKIPFGSNRPLKNFVWRPLTKDPGSKLLRKNDIYNLVDRYSLYVY